MDNIHVKNMKKLRELGECLRGGTPIIKWRKVNMETWKNVRTDETIEVIQLTEKNFEKVLQVVSNICEKIDMHYEADNDYMDCTIAFNNGFLHIPFGDYLVRTNMKIPCFLPEENYYVVFKEHQLKANYEKVMA